MLQFQHTTFRLVSIDVEVSTMHCAVSSQAQFADDYDVGFGIAERCGENKIFLIKYHQYLGHPSDFLLRILIFYQTLYKTFDLCPTDLDYQGLGFHQLEFSILACYPNRHRSYQVSNVANTLCVDLTYGSDIVRSESIHYLFLPICMTSPTALPLYNVLDSLLTRFVAGTCFPTRAMIYGTHLHEWIQAALVLQDDTIRGTGLALRALLDNTTESGSVSDLRMKIQELSIASENNTASVVPEDVEAEHQRFVAEFLRVYAPQLLLEPLSADAMVEHSEFLASTIDDYSHVLRVVKELSLRSVVYADERHIVCPQLGLQGKIDLYGSCCTHKSGSQLIYYDLCELKTDSEGSAKRETQYLQVIAYLYNQFSLTHFDVSDSKLLYSCDVVGILRKKAFKGFSLFEGNRFLSLPEIMHSRATSQAISESIAKIANYRTIIILSSIIFSKLVLQCLRESASPRGNMSMSHLKRFIELLHSERKGNTADDSHIFLLAMCKLIQEQNTSIVLSGISSAAKRFLWSLLHRYLFLPDTGGRVYASDVKLRAHLHLLICEQTDQQRYTSLFRVSNKEAFTTETRCSKALLAKRPMRLVLLSGGRVCCSGIFASVVRINLNSDLVLLETKANLYEIINRCCHHYSYVNLLTPYNDLLTRFDFLQSVLDEFQFIPYEVMDFGDAEKLTNLLSSYLSYQELDTQSRLDSTNLYNTLSTPNVNVLSHANLIAKVSVSASTPLTRQIILCSADTFASLLTHGLSSHISTTVLAHFFYDHDLSKVIQRHASSSGDNVINSHSITASPREISDFVTATTGLAIPIPNLNMLADTSKNKELIQTSLDQYARVLDTKSLFVVSPDFLIAFKALQKIAYDIVFILDFSANDMEKLAFSLGPLTFSSLLFISCDR